MSATPGDDLSDDIANLRVVLSWETLLGPPPGWYARAACREAGTRLWFGGTRRAAIAARATCSRCPARVECLEYALEYVELVGIWGGCNSDERSRIRAERRSGRDLVRPSAR
ncbi:MAG: WhiB family transcriptional regulator [Actinomycetia bacterium]|jgi:WhiB family redox-sensing transcriptional regulator|nr:WhiB family transcriptional regulator [Actinomycetes bacterium]